MLHTEPVTPTQRAQIDAAKSRMAKFMAMKPPPPAPPKMRPAGTNIFKSSSADVGGTYYGEVPQRMENRRSLHPSLKEIMDAVCEFFETTPLHIASERRNAEDMRPRRVYYHLAKTLTAKSFPEIGRSCGGKDHTTILSGCRRAAKLISQGDPIVSEIKHVKQIIDAKAISPIEILGA